MTIRDTQRQRLYDAEACGADRAPGQPSKWGQTIPNTDLQAWVDAVLARRAVRARWGQRHIEVELSKGGGRSWGPGRIALGVLARNPWVILHEIAHSLNTLYGTASHGPEFAGVYLFLVDTVLGPEAGKAVRAAFREHRVRWNRKGVPTPSMPVRTKAAAAAKRRAVDTRPPTRTDMDAAAETLRRAARAGVFGPAGRKPREHAMATARALTR